jgi:chromosome segregation ATPase
MSELILSNTAEQRAIEKKRAELQALEAQLALREPELATLQNQMKVFETRYLQIIGARYDELAEIEREIAGLQGLTPDDDTWGGESLADDEVGCGQNRFHSDRLKRLYREFARKFHPDLADDETARLHCHQLMVEANRAYEAGSEEAMQALFDLGKLQDELVNASPELVWLTRRVAALQEQLTKVESELAELTKAELYRLKLRMDKAAAKGIDLFPDLLAQVERQIRKARNRLEALQSVRLTGPS